MVMRPSVDSRKLIRARRSSCDIGLTFDNNNIVYLEIVSVRKRAQLPHFSIDNPAVFCPLVSSSKFLQFIRYRVFIVPAVNPVVVVFVI